MGGGRCFASRCLRWWYVLAVTRVPPEGIVFVSKLFYVVKLSLRYFTVWHPIVTSEDTSTFAVLRQAYVV
jgi:hypothetical protein